MTAQTAPSEKIEQVQIRLMGSDGEWFQPAYHGHAVLAALRAIAEDIRVMTGSYSEADLRKFREALRDLDAVIEHALPAPRCTVCGNVERHPKHAPSGNFNGGHDFAPVAAITAQATA